MPFSVVVALAADDDVVAEAARISIAEMPLPPCEQVVAVAAEDDVVADAAIDVVVAGIAVDDVVTGAVA